MSHPYDELVLEGSAALIFTPCPGTKGESLNASLLTLKQAGASAIITLMPTEEMERNAVTDLPERCAELELEWFQCPIEDDHAPQADFATAWQSAGPMVHQLLDEGKTVAIHCKGGSGRTGLMAAQILLERGQSKAAVKSAVQALRPYALTLEPHVQYFDNFKGD